MTRLNSRTNQIMRINRLLLVFAAVVLAPPTRLVRWQQESEPFPFGIGQFVASGHGGPREGTLLSNQFSHRKLTD